MMSDVQDKYNKKKTKKKTCVQQTMMHVSKKWYPPSWFPTVLSNDSVHSRLCLTNHTLLRLAAVVWEALPDWPQCWYKTQVIRYYRIAMTYW